MWSPCTVDPQLSKHLVYLNAFDDCSIGVFGISECFIRVNGCSIWQVSEHLGYVNALVDS